ncbi:YciI family protein [Chitinophaga sp. 212800010-3]|uniref:YciI family protein n=1 Tax=unclassified Chitinophaga TaxID=2619133 RepID=UPI002DEE713B|nr:YCII domain-containing protein [Chitinophaga sp. 212800010-3]
MKKEFMLYIRNAGDAKAALSAEAHLAFIKKCEVYIRELQASNSLIAAQPLIREGTMLSRNHNGWVNKAIDAGKEIQVGYYHIRADNMEEAIAIARNNPEFEYVPSASIEIRPVKMKEEDTNFVYPKQ